MNLFQLVFKQMRQRALSTWLTLLSVMLGVALAVAILILYRGGDRLFAQSDFGYDLIVGPSKGSPLELVLNTVYHLDQSPGNLPYDVYETLQRNRTVVRHAVPFAVGDTYRNHRIVGTSPKLFGFTDDGQPLQGWDETGRLLPDYQNPFIPEAERDPDQPVAAEPFAYRLGRKYQLARGRMFDPNRYEAVIGSDVPARTGLRIGSTFQATHGAPAFGAEDHLHEDQVWTVVGILEPTRTANDRVLFIPIKSFFAIEEHEKGMEDQAQLRQQLQQRGAAPPAQPEPSPAPARPAPPPSDHDHDHDHGPELMSFDEARVVLAQHRHGHDDHDDHGHDDHDHAHAEPGGLIHVELPREKWQLSAILVKARGPFQAQQLMYHYRMIDPTAVAVSPAVVMRDFFNTFLRNTTLVLLLIAIMVTIVAAVGILVSIYNSVSARKREIAILRALGATRTRILSLICLEAALVGLIGGILGLIGGHLIAAAGSAYLDRLIGSGIDWAVIHYHELLYLLAVVLIAVLAGLVPALKAYRTPVATNLTAA